MIATFLSRTEIPRYSAYATVKALPVSHMAKVATSYVFCCKESVFVASLDITNLPPNEKQRVVLIRKSGHSGQVVGVAERASFCFFEHAFHTWIVAVAMAEARGVVPLN